MAESRHRIAILAALALAAVFGARAPAWADDGAVCDEHLTAIGRALAAYQRDRGELPAHLSDLYPAYLPDVRLLHCPADRSVGSPVYEGGARDPLPLSYIYEMSNAAAPPGLSLGLNPRQPEDGATWRQVKQLDQVGFGDRVPIVSCWHHLQAGYRAYLTPAGQVYHSATYWEFDPGTLLAMAGQLERDLTAGAPTFLRNWQPGSIAWYSFLQEGRVPVADRHRLRVVADEFSAAIRAEPQLAAAGAWSAAGSLRYAAGDRKQAVAAYEAATHRPELTQAPAFLLLASLSHHAGEQRREAELLRRMPHVGRDDLDWITRLANSYTVMGEPGRAAEWWLRRADLEAMGRPGVQEPTDEDAGTCVRHLQAIGRALAAYQRDRMELPVHLSDLYPAYLSDRRLLHCPSDSSPGDQGYRWMETDPVPVSYLYEMSLARHPRGMMLGPAPGGRVVTWRDLKMCHRVHFGDRVPVVSCWHHLQRRYRLNLTLSGQVYCSSLDWEDDPDSVMALLDRMERDLAAGYEPFRRRWWPGTVAWFFFAQARWAPEEVRDRMRVVAGRLAAAQRRDSRLALNSVAELTGSLWYAAGDTEKAIAAFGSAMRLPGRYPATAYLLLADVYRHTGRAEEARDLLRQAPAPEPWEIRSISLLAGIYAETGRPEQAAVWARQLPAQPRRLDLNSFLPLLTAALAFLVVLLLAILGALWAASRRRPRLAPAAAAPIVPPPGPTGFDLQRSPDIRPAHAPTDFSRPASAPSPPPAPPVSEGHDREEPPRVPGDEAARQDASA